MKKTLFLVLAGALVGCGSSDGAKMDLTTEAGIKAYLEGKQLVMTGDNIPTHPMGYNENVQYGGATQCYQSTTIDIAAGVWNVTSVLGTLNNAPNVGNVGTCDHSTAGNTATFASTAIGIPFVQGAGECFDINVTYPSFGQEGRAKFNADGTELTMELFFAGQPAHHRRADGAVGATGVTLTVVVGGTPYTTPFTGNAQQVYTVSAP